LIFYRSSQSLGFKESKESDEEVFRAVDGDYQKELKISRSRFEKVALYMNEIFRALASYDVRFEFDPLSVDDHRCEVVSPSELKLTCELKHISKRSYKVEGDASNGRVQIRLRDDIRRHRYD
jgi:nucleotidyltransferase/DNA polymerase involved in DNA repair